MIEDVPRRGHRSTRRELAVLVGTTVLMATLFLVLAAVVWHKNAPVRLDRAAQNLGITSGQTGPLGGDPWLAQRGEWLGSPRGVAASALALFALAVLVRDWIAASVVLLAPAASFVLTEYLAKPLINEHILYGGRQYPSGHIAGITAVAVTALILLYRRWGALAAVAFAPVAVAAVATVALAVLALDFHHYPTDVIGGAMLGAALALMFTTLLAGVDRYRPRDRAVSGVPFARGKPVESGQP